MDWYAKDNLQPGHDPSIVRFDDGYALMTTNNNLELWTSEDMVTWKDHGKTMHTFPLWIFTYAPSMENVWAPDIYKFDDEFRVYYCGSVFGKRTSAIGYTASKSIVPGTAGYGWTDKGHVFHTIATDKYNAIDADVIKTSNGEYWMAFGSFGLGIQLIKLDGKSGYQASDDKTVYNIARRISSASGGAVEGPSLIEHGGQFFLFTAWDKCCQQGENIEQTTYKTAMGRADKVTGPYLDRSGKDLARGGGTILMERYGRYIGPGGGEPFQDINRVRFVHHYYDNAGDKFNHIHIRDVVFTDDNWAEMGQPFLGRYLSAEVEHGVLTRGVSGDLVITSSKTASNGEYLAYINTAGTVVHLPMNIPQAGDYLLRYRYANGGTAAATHGVSVNGKETVVELPPTGAWGTFPEKSVVIIPAKLKRGGNFIDVRPIPNGNFSELDRIDFLRVIRDTIPGNGFDNGIRIRLDENDRLAMKDGGYAIFENIVTDSIKNSNVEIQFLGTHSGKLSLHLDEKSGTVISECDLSADLKNVDSKNTADGWNTAECSVLNGGEKLDGVHDFYLTASGISSEVVVGNIKFVAPENLASSSDAVIESSSSSGVTTGFANANMAKLKYSVQRVGNDYIVRLNGLRAQNVYLLNTMGQVVAVHHVAGANAVSEVRFGNLPKGNYVVQIR